MYKNNKVCFVSPFAYGFFYPESSLKFGGSEVQVSLLARELAKDSYFSVSILLLDNGQKWKTKMSNGIKLIRAHRRGKGINVLLATFKIFFVLLRENPDCVICRAFGAEVGIARVYAKFFRKKFIYSIASDGDVDGNFFSTLRGRIFKFGFETADALVAQSQKQLADFLKRYPSQEDKISIIRNSIDIVEDSVSKREYVLWVGSSAPVKRPEIFLDLAKAFPEYKFKMIMTKSSLNTKGWEVLTQEAGSMTNIEILPLVPFDKIGRYFKEAKVLVSTSDFEGFPNVFLQAGVAKTAVLSLKVDPDKFLLKNECGISCGDNLEIMKLNLRRIFVDVPFSKKLSENLFSYVKKEHNIKINIEKWKELIRKK